WSSDVCSSDLPHTRFTEIFAVIRQQYLYLPGEICIHSAILQEPDGYAVQLLASLKIDGHIYVVSESLPLTVPVVVWRPVPCRCDVDKWMPWIMKEIVTLLFLDY